ncbi:hypothetical protein M0813_09990 [Anaeramoeba flamelloides]|uniref:WDR11 first beta-propeller domain-containing protein n=1 Tax=Anaeramoeba flamelloides TaxID=1746091 RepID=A0ABQ8X461_9EUKA|nr:hypothetical protein M0813_09990 [Anaeramoeba flamelloides]
MSNFFRPQTIVGQLNEKNKRSLTSGYNLIAYGCQSAIVLFDPTSFQITQVLESYPSLTTCVSFANTKYPQTMIKSQLDLPCLASGHEDGVIQIWAIRSARQLYQLRADFPKGEQFSVLSLSWFTNESQDQTAKHLMALYSNGMIVMWKLMKNMSQLLWKRNFQHPIVSLSFDPFNPKHLCFTNSMNSIYFVKNFVPERKLTIPESSIHLKNSQSKDKQDLKQICYSPHFPNIIIFLFDYELFLFDSKINQVLYISNNLSKHSFHRLLFSTQRENLFFVLHEEGSISSWKLILEKDIFFMQITQFVEQFQITRSPKITPMTNLNFALQSNEKECLFLVDGNGSIIKWDYHIENSLQTFPYNMINHSNEEKKNEKSKLILSGIYYNICNNPTCLSVYKTDLNENKNNLIAIGNDEGVLQVFELPSKECISQIQICKNNITGIKWINGENLAVISSNKKENNRFLNEIYFFNLKSSFQQKFPKNNQIENYSIKEILISFTKRFLTILYTSGDFVIYDLINYTPLHKITQSLIDGFVWSSQLNKGDECFLISIKGQKIIQAWLINEKNLYRKSSFRLNFPIEQISSMVWQKSQLIIATKFGKMFLFDTRTKKNKIIKKKDNKIIEKILFQPNLSHIFFTLNRSGEIGIGNLDTCMIKIQSHIIFPKKVLDFDFLSNSSPIILYSDGCIRLFNYNLTNHNSPSEIEQFDVRPFSPIFYENNFSLALKILIQIGLLNSNTNYKNNENGFLNNNNNNNNNNNSNSNSNSSSNNNQNEDDDRNKDNIQKNCRYYFKKILFKKWQLLQDNFNENKKKKNNYLKIELKDIKQAVLLSPKLKNILKISKNIAQRCFLISECFTDNEERKFWTTFLYYHNKFNGNETKNIIKTSMLTKTNNNNSSSRTTNQNSNNLTKNNNNNSSSTTNQNNNNLAYNNGNNLANNNNTNNTNTNQNSNNLTKNNNNNKNKNKNNNNSSSSTTNQNNNNLANNNNTNNTNTNNNNNTNNTNTNTNTNNLKKMIIIIIMMIMIIKIKIIILIIIS